MLSETQPWRGRGYGMKASSAGRILGLFAAGVTILGPGVPGAHAAHLGLTVYGLTVSHRLVTFQSGAPGVVLSSVKITGLADGERLVGIDFRPATNGLYGVASLAGVGRVVSIDTTTGLATGVGAATFALVGADFDVDFNPTVDRIRLVSDAGQNLRLNPVTGALAATDVPLAYAAGDVNAGAAPAAVGAAYTNNDNNAATSTTLYDVDAALDVLVTQNPPNNGTLNTVGALGAGTLMEVGFDIWARLDATGAAVANFGFAALSSPGNSAFYEVNLTTGVASSLGSIASNPRVVDVAIATA